MELLLTFDKVGTIQMKAEETLRIFLSKALKERWRERYLSLIKTEKGQGKFLTTLSHDFEDKLETRKLTKIFPEEIWALPAYLFMRNETWGKEKDSVKKAFDSSGDGILIIDKTGSYGIYRPEDSIDNIKYVKL